MNQNGLAEVLESAHVVPVLTIEDVDHAVPLARALVEGGLRVLEVTLRTPVALAAVAAIRAHVPAAICGVGTVLSAAHLTAAEEAGAAFAVSPGATDALLSARSAIPLLPGAATASEVMALLDRGITLQKFFPAEAAGGVPALSSFAAPLSAARFCPTGGITPANVAHYRALPNVICVGGSWMVPKRALALQDWAQIRELAEQTRAARG